MAETREISGSRMARRILGIAAAGLAIAAGCVTVNVYFPAAEVEKVADAIVSEIRPEGLAPPAAAPAPPPAPAEGAGAALPRTRGPAISALIASALWAAPGVAHAAAADGIDLEIDTPLLRRIRAALKARYPTLLPYYARGIIGEVPNGEPAIRTLDGLERQEVGKVRSLVADEIRDRKAMYEEIARANAIDPSKIPNIARIFGKTFIEKLRPGYWYRDAKGTWRKREKDKPPQI
ncbi:MAG: YdbL family protein [Planctomycetes bacterium]|nr:YdbL family protein [Planctomycetota bacterium]